MGSMVVLGGGGREHCWTTGVAGSDAGLQHAAIAPQTHTHLLADVGAHVARDRTFDDHIAWRLVHTDING
jgi:hypothetical protein